MLATGADLPDEARAWYEKYLHPPCTATPSGIPDLDSSPSTVVPFRNSSSIACPPGITTGTWDLVVLGVPSVTCPIVYWAYPSGTVPNWAAAAAPAVGPKPVYNPDMLPTSWLTWVDKYRAMYSSFSVYLDANDLSNQGAVYASQTRFDVNEQQNTATQIYQIASLAGGGGAISQPMFTGDTVLMSSPRSYQGLAKDGVFMPLRFAQPTQLYADTLWAPEDGEQLGLQLALFTGTAVNRVTIQNPAERFTGMTWGNILFTGLSPNATVRIKQLHGYEVSATVQGPWTFFASNAARPNPLAIERAYRTVFDLPDAYPVSANALGLWNTLKSYAPKILDYLDSDLAAAIPGIGGTVRAGAKLGKMIMPQLESIVESAEAKAFGSEASKAGRAAKSATKKLVAKVRKKKKGASH